MLITKQQIILMVEKWLDGSIRTEERKALADLLEDPSNRAVIESVMDEELLQELYTENGRQEKMLHRLHHTLNVADTSTSRPIHRIHFLKTAWFKYAAAILIIFGSVAYLWINNRNHKSLALASGSGRLQVNISPASDKAVLTLADGTKILLDSAPDGNLAQQGNAAIVKLSNGQIAYHLNGLDKGKVKMNTLSTPKGGRYQVVLPDGSRVWLNAASSISFPTVFTGNSRQVEMTGEAYMEVAKNAKQSFTVKANGVDIQVLGTSFNVNAYENETTLKTTLISGSIKVIRSSGQPSEAVILKPDQQAIVTPSGQPSTGNKSRTIVISSNVDSNQVVAWKNGVFNFEGAGFEEVMRQLERWYDIEVVYEKGIPDIQFGGKLSRNVSLKDLLEILERTEVHFKMEGEKRLVVVKP